ncbi:MAG: helix-turn-helix domain-containing protein [Pseudolysinimonas sp.]
MRSWNLAALHGVAAHREEKHLDDGSHSRRKRGSLSPDEIVAAALRLLDGEGESALTFTRLGAELKASPTAVYRHFASRQDLVLAIADTLDGISLDGYVPTDDWRADLNDLAWRAWKVAEEHPAAAAIAMGLNTNGINELRAVDAVLRALHMRGLRGRDAVAHYQVYSNLVLAAAAAHGARLASSQGEPTEGGWVQSYSPADPTRYPYAEAVKVELRLVDDKEIFSRQVAMLLGVLSPATS